MCECLRDRSCEVRKIGTEKSTVIEVDIAIKETAPRQVAKKREREIEKYSFIMLMINLHAYAYASKEITFFTNFGTCFPCNPSLDTLTTKVDKNTDTIIMTIFTQ